MTEPSEETTLIIKRTRLGRLYDSYSKLPPVFVDGVVCVMIGWLSFWNSTFGGDEAAKYITSMVLFWLKGIIGSFCIALVQLQSFRSRQYASHMEAKEKQQIAAETTVTQTTDKV